MAFHRMFRVLWDGLANTKEYYSLLLPCLANRTADALIKYGALVVKDSRVSEEDNSVFLDLLEDYFAQPDEALRKDIRPEYGYQGWLY